MIQELAGGKITGAVQDVYPAVAEPYTVEVTYEKINTLIGKDIPVETVKSILASLEMEIISETARA